MSDGSKAGDWRLPTRDEWKAMMDERYKKPVLSNAAGTGQWKEGDAFSDVQADFYWSSTAVFAVIMWSVNVVNGVVNYDNKPSTYYIWPVRGGQLTL